MRRTPKASEATATGASLVYDLLRTDVLRGAFRPSSKLVFESLRERYGFGVIPIREALNRLSAEGFVEQHDKKGFSVPAVSARELAELTRTRCLLHAIIVPDALAAATAEWEERLVLAGHYLFKARRQPDGASGINPEWEAQHRAFHLAIVEACPSRWLRDFHANLFDNADRYRHLYVSEERKRGLRDVDKEHREILEAAIARSVPQLVDRLDQHIRLTTDFIAGQAGSAPAARVRGAKANLRQE